MGTVTTIGFNKFPKQHNVSDSTSGGVGRKVEVHFGGDTMQTIIGVILRDDKEYPFMTIIQLADGRIVLANECQYTALSDVDVSITIQFTLNKNDIWI